MTFRRLWARLTARFSRRRADADFDDELESHLVLHIDDNLRAGMSRGEARRLALAKLGAANAVREAHRDTRAFAALDMLARDVRHGVRLMRRQPLFTTVAVLSLALGIGLYGVMAYAVTQRRREIGVRTALGATPASVVRLVTTRVAVTLVLGLAAGALLARWTGRFVESLLFGVTPADVVTFAAATGMLLATGVTAALLPAWRAARTSPADVLREE